MKISQFSNDEKFKFGIKISQFSNDEKFKFWMKISLDAIDKRKSAMLPTGKKIKRRSENCQQRNTA